MPTDDESQIELISRLSVPRYATRLNPTPIPTAHWDDAPLYCLKVNDEWISHILGVMVALDQPDTWIGTADEIYAARQQVNEIMVAFMEQCDPMSNCCPEPLIRVNADGTVSVSYDGGMTYNPATTEDPRNIIPQPPPLPGDDGLAKRCTAANNVLGQFKDFKSRMDGIFDTADTVGAFVLAVATAIAAIIFSPAAIPIIVSIELAIFSALFVVPKEEYDAVFTDTVWGKLLCIIYCHTQPDGTYTEADVDAIIADINTQFSATDYLTFHVARDAFLGMLKSARNPGMNVMAKITTGSYASCDSCDCPSCNMDAWQVYGTRSGEGSFVYGTETARDDISVTMDSVAQGGGYIQIIWTADPAICCAVGIDTAGVSVTTSWIPCGGTFPVTTGIYAPSDCTYLLQLQSLVPFTTVYTFNPC